MSGCDPEASIGRAADAQQGLDVGRADNVDAARIEIRRESHSRETSVTAVCHVAREQDVKPKT